MSVNDLFTATLKPVNLGLDMFADDLQRQGDIVEDGLVFQQPEVLENRADFAP